MDYNEELYCKMQNELNEYKQYLLSRTPKEILREADEYYIKQDIVLCLEYMDLEEEEAKALLEIEHPLQKVFLDWLDRETEYMYEVRENIRDSARKILKEVKV